jgi:hypothetical protein
MTEFFDQSHQSKVFFIWSIKSCYCFFAMFIYRPEPLHINFWKFISDKELLFHSGFIIHEQIYLFKNIYLNPTLNEDLNSRPSPHFACPLIHLQNQLQLQLRPIRSHIQSLLTVGSSWNHRTRCIMLHWWDSC